MATKPTSKAEYGDFQTPIDLALAVCRRLDARVGSVVEPTCGLGSFLLAARRTFGEEPAIVGLDINGDHLEQSRIALERAGLATGVTLVCADFFAFDYESLFDRLAPPLLVLGNPPWVTNADLGSLDSNNLPEKRNFHGRDGLEAITGRSNFDISEWMGMRLLEDLAGRDATVALLLKVGVARKLLLGAWSRALPVRDAFLRPIDARRHFGAAVDACLFGCRTDRRGEPRARVFDGLDGDRVVHTLAMKDGELIADVDAYERTASLRCADQKNWRSGIKHDAAKIFELRERDGQLVNGLGEAVQIEDDLLYPLLKGSDVAKGVVAAGRWLIVPQRTTGEDTRALRVTAPKAWHYLDRHRERLAGRKSSIYAGRPPFSIFGVGPYTFARWKVAVSGLHKRLRFALVPPQASRPVVFDDTVYFLPCESEAEARRAARLLRSPLAADFFSSSVFWDAKRPLTAALLRRLDLDALAHALEDERVAADGRRSSPAPP